MPDTADLTLAFTTYKAHSDSVTGDAGKMCLEGVTPWSDWKVD